MKNSPQAKAMRMQRSKSELLKDHDAVPPDDSPPYPCLVHPEDPKTDQELGFHHGFVTKKYSSVLAKLPPGSYYPSTDHDRDNGQIDRTLPENIYGAFILIWLNKSSDYTSHVLWWAVKTGLPVALLASHYAQLTFSYYLFKIVYRPHTRDVDDPLSNYCTEGSPILKFLACAAFLSLCFGDLLESYDMHLWLNMFKTVPDSKHQKLRVHLWKDTSNKAVVNTMIYLPASGITSFARVVFYVLVLVPKLLVCLCIAIAGSGLVLRSDSDYDLVLNAVAAGFVLELDEVVYRVFLTHLNKNMACCPPLGVTQDQVAGNLWRYVYSSDYAVYFSGAGVITSVAIVHSFWC